MTDKPPEDDKRPDADEAFAATLRNLVNTPHKPHAPLGKERVTDSTDSKRKGRSKPAKTAAAPS